MKDHTFSVSRRKFIQRVATATIATPFIIRCSSNAPSSKTKLNHACIGVGGMGWSDLQKFKEDPNVQIVAICDVDADKLKKASEALPDASTYTDWRELLKKERNRIDSVNVTVPDKLLEWDAVNMKFPNYPDANKYVRRSYRKGWNVAGF